MALTEEARIKLYNMLYAKISKVTAEIKNNKGEHEKLIFKGTAKDLFKDVDADPRTITRFLWAVSHKTEVLPTVLFNIVDHGSKGIEISRKRSGFKDENGKMVDCADLIPFIIKATKFYQVKPHAKKEHPVEAKINDEARVEYLAAKIDLTQVSTEDLAAELTARGWTIAYGLI